jgi:hypothetical protein
MNPPHLYLLLYETAYEIKIVESKNIPLAINISPIIKTNLISVLIVSGLDKKVSKFGVNI